MVRLRVSWRSNYVDLIIFLSMTIYEFLYDFLRSQFAVPGF